VEGELEDDWGGRGSENSSLYDEHGRGTHDDDEQDDGEDGLGQRLEVAVLVPGKEEEGGEADAWRLAYCNHVVSCNACYQTSRSDNAPWM
jgi:hypothetical protein